MRTDQSANIRNRESNPVAIRNDAIDSAIEAAINKALENRVIETHWQERQHCEANIWFANCRVDIRDGNFVSVTVDEMYVSQIETHILCTTQTEFESQFQLLLDRVERTASDEFTITWEIDL